MISLLVALAGIAEARDTAELIQQMPRSAAVMVGCNDLYAAGAWFGDQGDLLEGGEQMARALSDPEQARAAGLDVEGPLLVVATAGGENIALQLHLADEAVFRAQMLPVLLEGARPVEGVPDAWVEEDGSQLSLFIQEDVAELRMGDWTPVEVPRTDLLPLLDRLRPDLGGCWIAADLLELELPMAQDASAEALLIQGADDGSRFVLAATGVALPTEIQSTLTGISPVRSMRGTGLEVPDLVMRINADSVDALIAAQQVSLLLGWGLPPIVGAGGALLEQSTLQVRSGVELAMGGMMDSDEPYAALVLPVARPRLRWRLERGLERAFSDLGLTPVRLGDAWSLDGVGGMEGWWMGTTRGALVVANKAHLIQDVVDGVGEPWVPESSASLASQPGVWVGVDLAPLALPIVATAHLGSPQPGEVLVSLDAPGLMDGLSSQGPDLVEDLGLNRERPTSPPSAPDPVGDPPSTEALAVLMLIASREAAVMEEEGAYLAYSGGPRAIEELDGQAVPWEGIPDLGLVPMETSCRFEVRVDHQGWLATAWCDQDGDGEAAVTLLRPGGTPIKVSPPGVR